MPTSDAGPVAFSPDCGLLAIGFGQGSGEVRLLNAATYENIAVLANLGSGPSALAFSADGKELVTGLHDQTALVWDLATGFCAKIGKGEEMNTFGVLGSLLLLAGPADGAPAEPADADGPFQERDRGRKVDPAALNPALRATASSEFSFAIRLPARKDGDRHDPQVDGTMRGVARCDCRRDADILGGSGAVPVDPADGGLHARRQVPGGRHGRGGSEGNALGLGRCHVPADLGSQGTTRLSLRGLRA